MKTIQLMMNDETYEAYERFAKFMHTHRGSGVYDDKFRSDVYLDLMLTGAQVQMAIVGKELGREVKR